MLYIHKIASISPFDEERLFLKNELPASEENKLYAVEPSYDEIPRTVLRRMAKAVRLSVGAALPLLKDQPQVDGIILGTANGGMEESIRFMNQIVEFEEGMLTPGNFVQSTPNALASQIAMFNKNRRYNITHTHRGLSFENALLDAEDLLKENPEASLLVGGADEISTYNYNIDLLAGWYRRESISNKELFNSPKPGSLAGEGAAMFFVSGESGDAIAKIKWVETLHCADETQIKTWMKDIIEKRAATSPTVLMTGENGDSRFDGLYNSVEEMVYDTTAVVRFKQLTGEFPTASALGLYLVCRILGKQQIPRLMIKRGVVTSGIRSVLIYNNYHGIQHSMMLVEGLGN